MAVGSLLHSEIVPCGSIGIIRPLDHAVEQSAAVLGQTVEYAVDKRHRLCVSDILIRTERTIRIAVDPTLVCGDTDLILCPVGCDIREFRGRIRVLIVEASGDCGKFRTGDRRIRRERAIVMTLYNAHRGQRGDGVVEPLTACHIGQAVGLGGICGADFLGQQTEEDGCHFCAGDIAIRLDVAVRVTDNVRKVIVTVQTGRYIIRNVNCRLAAAAATAGRSAGPYADQLDILLNVLDLGYNIATTVDTPAAERVAALRGGLYRCYGVAAALLNLGCCRNCACIRRNVAGYFVGYTAEPTVCSLERQCIGNSLFANRVFISVVGIAFTITVPTLVGIVRQLFLAVVIPAYDRVVAVVQYPVLADRCKSDAAIASVSFILIGTVVNIIASNQCMVVIQLCTSRNSNFTLIADTAAILSFAAVALDNRVGTDFDHTAVSDCGNCRKLQFSGKKDVPKGTSFRLRFIQQLDDLCDLLLTLVLISGLKRILHTAGKMSAKNLSLRLMHQRFHRLQLHHNIHAVAVVLDHFEHAVDLPARGFEQRLDLFTICHHLMSTTS